MCGIGRTVVFVLCEVSWLMAFARWTLFDQRRFFDSRLPQNVSRAVLLRARVIFANDRLRHPPKSRRPRHNHVLHCRRHVRFLRRKDNPHGLVLLPTVGRLFTVAKEHACLLRPHRRVRESTKDENCRDRSKRNSPNSVNHKTPPRIELRLGSARLASLVCFTMPRLYPKRTRGHITARVPVVGY